jgi:hypothetical protein
MGDLRIATESMDGLVDDLATASPSVLALSTRPGSGHICDACQQAIESSQVEYRTREESTPFAGSGRFHQWCYYAKFASNR